MILTQENIKKTVQDYFKDKPVNKVYLFGSYARGDANEDSDVDLLVELDYSKHIGFSFYGWKDELKNHLNKKVEVVSEKGLSKFIGPFILKDKNLVYER
jgi:predicted nucleotidyltransferase